MKIKKSMACMALGVTLLSAGTYSSVQASAYEDISQPEIQVIEGDADVNPNAKAKALVNGAKYLGGFVKKKIFECFAVGKFTSGGIIESPQTTQTRDLEVLFDQ